MNWYRKLVLSQEEPEMFDYEGRPPQADLSELPDDTIYDYHDERGNAMYQVLEEFLATPEGQPQPWRYIPFPRVKKIWNDYIKFGFVRDEKGIDLIAGIMIENVQKLAANTTLCGHTQSDPDDYFENYDFTEEQKERFYDYVKIISDYGLDPLEGDALALMTVQTAEEKLQIIDKMLQRAHMSGDLSEAFVEGGTETLNELFGGRPTYASNWYKRIKS